MIDLVGTMLAPFSGGAAAMLALFLLLYFTQDRAAGIGRLVATIGSVLVVPVGAISRASKRRKLQRRINGIMNVSEVGSMPLVARKCRVAWENAEKSREDFFEERRFVIHVRKNFDADEALIRTVLLFVARSLLVEVKRFLTEAQRDALNLYYTATILSRKSELLSRQFSVDFLPATLDSETADYLETYHTLEQHAVFEDLLVREFEHVGSKIVAHARADGLHKEFEALIEMLLRLTGRRPSEEIELTLERSRVRCAVVLVARPENVTDDMDAHVRYIQTILAPRQIERIYLLSDRRKSKYVDLIARSVASDWNVTRRKTRRAILLGSMSDAYVLELTSKAAGIVAVGASGPPSRHRFVEDPAHVVALTGRDTRVIGSIKWIHDEGWGFIRLDDPSFDSDAWFQVSSMLSRPAVIGRGDKVRCSVTRDHRGLRATNVEVDLELRRTPSVASNDSAALTSHVSVGTTGDAIGIVELDPERQSVVSDVLAILESKMESGVSQVPLAGLGSSLRRRDADFSHAKWGYSSLLSMITELGSETGSFYVDRFSNGHPFVSIGTNRASADGDDIGPAQIDPIA